MTGQYAHNHGVRSNDEGAWENLDQSSTIQAHLHVEGYKTALFGKYLNHFPLDESPPFFDDWAVMLGHPFYGGEWNVNGEIRSLPLNTYATSFLEGEAKAFLNSTDQVDDSQPWFLYLAPSAPHAPALPEPSHDDDAVPDWDGNPAVFEEDRGDKPPFVQAAHDGWGPAKVFRKHQYRTLMSIDESVMRIFDLLETLGEADDTLAVFVSDNGMLWGEHGLRGKAVPYTPAVRVPMLMRWPGHVEPGNTDSRLAANIDIAPTIAEAAQLTGDYRFDGKSLVEAAPWNRDAILLEFWRAQNPAPAWSSIRTPTYQYTEYYEVRQADTLVTFREYYELESDPFQLDNVLADKNALNDPSLMAQFALAQNLRSYQHCKESACP